MTGNDWLAAQRNEVAADRILDAAGELFAAADPGSVGMHEIAKAAGCSRATLYRYFENRKALHTAYVHRETYALNRLLTEKMADLKDPRERLMTGFTTSLALVRESPALASWFTPTQAPIGVEIAEKSKAIKALTAAFLMTVGPDDADVVERRARWMVRMITSLLLFPGRDEADERAILEEFIVPTMVPRDTDG